MTYAVPRRSNLPGITTSVMICAWLDAKLAFQFSPWNLRSEIKDKDFKSKVSAVV